MLRVGSKESLDVCIFEHPQMPTKKFADGQILMWVIEFHETVISSLHLLFHTTSLDFPPFIQNNS